MFFLPKSLLLLFPLLDCPSSPVENIYSVSRLSSNATSFTKPGLSQSLNESLLFLVTQLIISGILSYPLGHGLLKHRGHTRSVWSLPHVPIPLPWVWSIYVCCTNAFVSPYDPQTRWLPRSVFKPKCRHWHSQSCPLLKQHSYTLTRQGNPFLKDLAQRISFSLTLSYLSVVLLWLFCNCLSMSLSLQLDWILRTHNEVSLATYPQGLVHCWKQCEFHKCWKTDPLKGWMKPPHSLLQPPPIQRKGVGRSYISRPLHSASLLQQAELVSDITSRSSRLWTLSGPWLSQSRCTDIGTDSKFASVSLSEGIGFPLLKLVLELAN